MLWQLTDHACSNCFGRVLESEDGGSFRCSECGAVGYGDVQSVCACGVEIAGRRGVFHCVRNPSVTKAVPQEVLVGPRDEST